MRRLTWMAALLMACDGGEKVVDDTGGGGGDDTAETGETGETGDTNTLDPVCTEATDIPCVDAIISDLSLHDDETSDGEVTNTLEGEDWLTVLDASAGGSNQAANNPWLYVKFTDEGLVRVDIDDETALEDMGWDLALRRYYIRLNSGVSGPSCVGVDRQDRKEYADLTEIPDNAEYAYEAFYDEQCTLIDDGFGMGNPLTALDGWWDYTSCVETTMVPFVMQLADGHVLKLVVESYYGDDQADCNDNGDSPRDSAIIHIRWMYLN